MMMDWMDKAEALESKQITQDEYDQWRYHYPVVGQTIHTHFEKVIPQKLSDMLIAEGKKINKSETIRRNNTLLIVSAGLLWGKEKGLAKLILH